MDRATCAWRRRMGRISGPLRFSSVRLVDGDIDLQPEFASNQAGLVLFHNSPPIPRSITATGSMVVYLLRELLPRWRPPRRTFCDLTQHRYYTESTRTTFYRCCLEALVWVEALLGSATNPDAAHLFRGETARARISYAARQIVQCLIVLQTPIHRAQPCCLRCTSLPVNAPGVDENAAHVLEVRSNYSAAGNMNCGFTAIQTVSVLPPVREYDPPMLCEFHLYLFQFYMYRVINPTWPVPHFAQDLKKFGAIRVRRWSSTTNDFEFEDSINQ